MPVEDGVLFVASLRDHLLASAPAGNEKPAAAPAGKGRKRRAAKMAAPEQDAAVSSVSASRLPHCMPFHRSLMLAHTGD